MSRIGKLILEIPAKTTVEIKDKEVVVKGPLGEIKKSFDKTVVDIIIENNTVAFKRKGEGKTSKAAWGTYASHVRNMMKGVNEVYERKLILEGVGFKSEVAGDTLKLALGFSHPVLEKIPAGLKITAEKNNITISGIDKEVVGSYAAYIRSLKKPEPYKGKGFRYADEVIRRKQGKKSAK